MLGSKANNDAETMIRNLVSIMKKCKKVLLAANAYFDKNNVLDVSDGQAKSYEAMKEFSDYYTNIPPIRDLASKVPEKTLQSAAKDYDELMALIREYMINMEATFNIQEIIMGSIKHDKSTMVQKDQGYKKDGKLAQSKEILSNMPSVAFNSKL